MRKSFVILLAALFLLCTGCSKREEHTLQIFAMDTVMDFYAVGEGAQETLNAAAQEINRLESLLSRTRQGSEVDALNRHGSVVLSDETAALLRQALQLADETGGTLISPLSRWYRHGVSTQIRPAFCHKVRSTHCCLW